MIATGPTILAPTEAVWTKDILQDISTKAEIGRYLGGRSRAAISYAVKALADRMSRSREVRAQVESLL